MACDTETTPCLRKLAGIGNCRAFCWGLICRAPSWSLFPLTRLLFNKGIIPNKEIEAWRSWTLVRVIKASKCQEFRGGKAPCLAVLALPLAVRHLLPSTSSTARSFDTSKRSFGSARSSSQLESSRKRNILGKLTSLSKETEGAKGSVKPFSNFAGNPWSFLPGLLAAGD